MEKLKMYINGNWTFGSSSAMIETINPATGEKLYEVPRGNANDIDQAVQAAKRAFESPEWKGISPAERGRMLHSAAQIIRAKKEELASLEMYDTGKPLSLAMIEVEIGARYFEFYSGAADKILGETIPLGEDVLDFTRREPLGVTAHIVPWNGPFQMTCRSVAPALAAGNTAVIKPAEDTPLTALRLAEICETVGFPKGVVNVVTGYGYEAGAALASHSDIDHITFTGSVSTGISVMKAAAGNIKPVTLELGGKSPNIVFADANLEEAAHSVVRAITLNSGQVCSAGSRLLVERSIHQAFVEKVKGIMKALRIGKGEDNPDVGPLISEKQLQRVESFVEHARDKGAAIHLGGQRYKGEATGFFYEPTIVDSITPDSRLAQEEIFGPVLVVLPFDTIQEALQIANGTQYGLAAGIWTSNIDKAHWLANRIKAGQIFINNYGVGTGVEMPFGGYRKSGIGREKGLEALKYYTQVKNVAIKIGITH
jgi:acyl-CoA reductase-like NAD-dependent aldehyde dehydrogenase